MTKKQIIASDLNKGFYKITHDNGSFEYIKPSKLEELRKDKAIKLVETKEEKKEIAAISNEDSKESPESKAKELKKLNKNDLSEIAQRLGFSDEITDDVTKAMLIDFIIKNENQ